MSKFRPFSNKLLLLTDRPEDSTGLARIARDIASLACTLPQFKVAVLGRGSQGHSKFAWTSYSYPEAAAWGHEYLAGVTKDFFGSERGIVLTNWDVSRLGWLTGRGLTPELAKAYDPQFRNWDLHGYFPVDNYGPDGLSLNIEQRQTLPAFNRVMAASEWGAGVLKASGRPDATWLPHGIHNQFAIDPAPHAKLGWDADDITVGFVAANQARKDFPVAFHCAALLKQHYGNRFRFWVHTDVPVRSWNVYALAADYGINDCLAISIGLSDEQLAMRYSACDCTILPSGGEGFGYPIAESLACGTACIVTDYAAGQELVDPECRVKPVTFRVDTIYNVQRAVLSGWGFFNAAVWQIDRKREDREFRSEELRATVEHLFWSNLKHPWTRWLLDGIR